MRPLIELHRGLQSLFAGHLSATDVEVVDLFETDVQMTVDEALLLYHDYTLPDGRWVADSTLSECRSAVREHSSYDLLVLEDALVESRARSVGLMLDVKSGRSDTFRVHERLGESLMANPTGYAVHVCDWNHPGLGVVKMGAPDVTTRASLRGRPTGLVEMLRRDGVDGVNLAWDCTPSADIMRIRSAGFMVGLFGGWGDRYLPVGFTSGADVLSVEVGMLEALRGDMSG